MKRAWFWFRLALRVAPLDAWIRVLGFVAFLLVFDWLFGEKREKTA